MVGINLIVMIFYVITHNYSCCCGLLSFGVSATVEGTEFHKLSKAYSGRAAYDGAVQRRWNRFNRTDVWTWTVMITLTGI